MTDEKKIVSLNLPKEVVEYIDEESNNRSAFVADLVESHRDSKSIANEAVAEFRKRQLKQKKAALESELELFEDELDEIDETLQSSREQTEAELEEARDALVGNVDLEPTNPGVENWAEKLGMPPVELVDKLQEGESE